ncbi:MAG: uncharacterized protein QOE14_2493, partial [Humisphaera sp.]|nr:uncharacterized protein [Humisphaera sp.]
MSDAVRLFILIALVLGHLAIVRALISRGYEFGLPQRVWQMLVALLIALGIAGPILIVRVVRWKHHTPWTDLPLAWQLYLVACVIALVIGIVITVRRSIDSIPRAQLSSSSKVLDYSTGTTPSVSRLARLPGNEIFSVEIVQREIRLPRLPAQLDGLSILHITDLHMNGTPGRGFFEWAIDQCVALRPDLVAVTGDVIDHLGVVDWLPTTLGRLTAPLGCYFVLGNHDLHAGSDEIRSTFDTMAWLAVTGRVITKEFRGARLTIAGTERPWFGDDPPIDRATAPNELRILLSHAPHLIHWARRRNVDLLLAGHLHGGQIQWPLLGPIAGGRFHSGLFDLPPTIMHVSRGLGQMAPIRFGCRPEITKLVL